MYRHHGFALQIDVRLYPFFWQLVDEFPVQAVGAIFKEGQIKGAEAVRIIAPKLGQLVSDNENYVQNDWWLPLIDK